MGEADTRIAEWRAVVDRSTTLDGTTVDELEAYLRAQVSELDAVGLTAEEAFLVALQRLGRIDDRSRDLARDQRGRLWQRWDRSPVEATPRWSGQPWTDAVAFAVLAAVTIQVARVAAGFPGDEPTWLLRNASLLVLPFLAVYLARRRRLPARRWWWTAAPFLLLALVVNLFPYGAEASTELLVAAHLPVLLWFVVAYPYMGGVLRSHERRMDFVRFTGEWCIHYTLLALGGGVLVALTVAILAPTGLADPERLIEWVLPSGAAGAVVVAAWLVERRQQVVEQLAPVLTLLFTPLFAVMLTVAAVAYAATGLGAAFDRELVGVLDALMIVVLGLVLYGLSARDPSRPAGGMDLLQLLTVAAALVLDLMVLVSMVTRVAELGLTPNRTAALGLNLVLLVNLAVTAWLSARFVTGRGTFARLERWQTGYLPVFPAWAAIVVVLLPPLFNFT